MLATAGINTPNESNAEELENINSKESVDEESASKQSGKKLL